jgi:pimeloyl-ACP methyl ester carboxylesterase
MATLVIVPGAWSGAWVWQWLTPYLRDAGHQVHLVALSGIGERADLAHPGINLDTHITDVVTALEFADLRDVVLVGGSYAGMVITGVADRVPDRLAQVIYLDATVPEDGQSLYDAWGDDEAVRAAERQEAEAAGTPGFLPIPRAWMEAAIADMAIRSVMLERLTPHPLATFAQPIRLTNPDRTHVPHAFIHCAVTDGPEPPFLARVRADPNWRYVEIPFDHLAPITAPRETAAALLELV